MKNRINILVLLSSILIISPTFAGIYDDWPDDAICTWLEIKPEHKGYLAENKKRELNCFKRDNFSPRIEATTKDKYSSSESMSY